MAIYRAIFKYNLKVTSQPMMVMDLLGQITTSTHVALYSFDLSNFEAGKLAAKRYPANCVVGGDWVCLAESDDDALAQALKASAEEWAAPESRHHTDFEVEFVDA